MVYIHFYFINKNGNAVLYIKLSFPDYRSICLKKGKK